MGRKRREARALARLDDIPRRREVLRVAIHQLRASVERTATEILDLESELPSRPTCCRSCAMGNCSQWRDLTDKADRQDAELRRLEMKLASLAKPRFQHATTEERP